MTLPDFIEFSKYEIHFPSDTPQAHEESPSLPNKKERVCFPRPFHSQIKKE
jgi:hypothetical protein